MVNWAPDSTDGTYYSLAGNDVHLAADDPNSAITVVHEIGHAIMDDVYDDDFPPAPSCNPHSIQGATSQGCAWTEGFAEWFPSTVYNDPYFRWPSGASLNLETNRWGDTWATGDTVEGRVAGALIDLTDAANETPWDRTTEGSTPTWDVFTHGVQDTFSQYFGQRLGRGWSTGVPTRSTLFQNTIDYTFRDTLPDYVGRTRTQAFAPHNFRYTTRTPYWSVVATKPLTGSDHDLRLYDNSPMNQLLGTSAYGGSTVDFIAVDSNLRALGDYYPRVSYWSGTGGHVTQLAHGSDILTTTSSPTFTASRFLAVRDTYLVAGTPYTFTAQPSTRRMNPSVFLMGSTAGDTTTYVRPRSTALVSAAAGGAGASETFSFTPTASGWYGLVVLNESGSGTVTLTRTGGAAGAPIAPK